jgi:hypothetical protein
VLTRDPAGTIATCIAGSLDFQATLSWRCASDTPPEPIWTPLQGVVTHSLAETKNRESATRTIYCEIQALTDADLGASLESVLRSITETATLSEAVLETSAIYKRRTRVVRADIVQALAMDLREAGFPVRFGPSWTPAPGAAASVGARDAEEELGEFFRTHRYWRLA